MSSTLSSHLLQTEIILDSLVSRQSKSLAIYTPLPFTNRHLRSEVGASLEIHKSYRATYMFREYTWQLRVMSDSWKAEDMFGPFSINFIVSWTIITGQIVG